MNTNAETQADPRLGDLPDELLERGRRLADHGREIWLAGLGALDSAEEEGAHLFRRLVRRGERAESRVAARARDATDVERRAGEPDGRPPAPERVAEAGVTDVVVAALRRFGVPTRDEVRELGDRIDRLACELNALARALDEGHGAHRRASIFAVIADGGDWVVRRPGRAKRVGPFATRAEALEHGRALAAAAAPSRLTVFHPDGTVEETLEFDA